MRHAKSSWNDATLADFERPLNERGQLAAPFMGELMHAHGFEPYLILSSPAERAKSTTELVKKAGKFDAEVRFDRRIYEASPNALLQIVAEIDDSYRSALLVGHNPGIEGFIRYLTGQLEPMPTAALAVIDIDADNWDLIDEGRGVLQNVYRPKNEMK
jgi:phosphohistidine phosphatase